MSDAKRCDICGHFYIPEKVNWTMRISRENTERGTERNEYYDICMDCAKNKIFLLIADSKMLKEEFGNV